jgi:regulator of sigma E protease
VALLLVLTIVVFIHELGHFMVARWCGVKVQAFSIGFGREIFGFTDKHGTRWKFAWIPLGGYVRFMDDENAASAPSRDALERMTPEERSGAFQTKPLWQRAAVVAAGPAFNVISALLFLVALFWMIGVDGRTAVIDGTQPGSPAEKAGLRSGDLVTAVNGRSVERWVEVQRTISRSPNVAVDVTFVRDGRERTVTIVPAAMEAKSGVAGTTIELGDIGIVKHIPARVGSVLPGSAASRAGLQPGDTLLSIDGRPLRHFSDLVSTLRNGEGKPVEIVLARGSERQTVQITPDRHPTENRWLIGINHPAELRRFSLVDSVRFGAGEVGYYIEGMVRGIPQIPAAVFKALSMQKQQDIGGPIVIAEMSKQAIESGLGGFITWLALFSVMLGIMNLLPIPLLDGGHLMFYAIEAIRGKPLDERKQEFAFKIGIAVIGTMMFAAFFSDVVGKLRLLF